MMVKTLVATLLCVGTAAGLTGCTSRGATSTQTVSATDDPKVGPASPPAPIVLPKKTD